MTTDRPRRGPAGSAEAWVEHLRAGGTTTWARWRGPLPPDLPAPEDEPGAAAEPAVPITPGAQQLELLRVLNTLGEPGPALAERVLGASGLGRGRADLPLLGGPRSRFGPPGVDPEDLPVEELLRFAVLLVADDLAERAALTGPDPAASAVTGRRGRRGRRGLRGRREGRGRPGGTRRRRGVRLAGDPWVASRLEEALRERGRTPGDSRARVHVLAGPVDRLLADVWTARCLADPPPPWPRWLDAVAGGALPPGADVAGTAHARARRVGAGRVVVVTDLTRLPRLLGERRMALPTPLDAAAAELARRVGEALDVVVVPDRRPALLREHLLPRLLAHQEQGPAPVLPARHEAWARRCAERQRDRLREAGYAVAGDVDDLLPGRPDALRPGDGPAVPDGVGDDLRVLRLAGRLIVAGARPPGAGGGS